MFFNKCCFQLIWLGVVLFGIGHLVFQKEAHNRGLPSNSIIYTTLLSLDEEPTFGVVGGCSFFLLYGLFHSTLLHSIHFSLSITVYFKNGFFKCSSRKWNVEIWLRRFFFAYLIWNPKIKAMNITKLVKRIFSVWFGYFECVCYLWYGLKLTVLS